MNRVVFGKKVVAPEAVTQETEVTLFTDGDETAVRTTFRIEVWSMDVDTPLFTVPIETTVEEVKRILSIYRTAVKRGIEIGRRIKASEIRSALDE